MWDIPSTTYAVFGLYRYPAKFIPQVIAYSLKAYGRRGWSVFDPFAGYGTAGLVARIYGCPYELWDLNPMLVHIHEVATINPNSLSLVEAYMIERLIMYAKDFKGEFVPDWKNLSYWFPQEVLPFLFRVWGFYHSLDEKPVRNLFLIPLLKATRLLSYNDPQRQKLSRSPKSMGRVAALLAGDWQDIFWSTVKTEVAQVLSRLIEYQYLCPPEVPEARVLGGVDTFMQSLDEEQDILITSPPYLQAQEYIRNSKMDLFWLGYSESRIRELSKLEIPYRRIPLCPIYSPTYEKWLTQLHEPHIREVFQRYFCGVLGALTCLQEKVRHYLLLFVGPATIRSQPVPIDEIFKEHFTTLGWRCQETLVDRIESRVLFSSPVNPATGLPEQRIKTERLLVMKRG